MGTHSEMFMFFSLFDKVNGIVGAAVIQLSTIISPQRVSDEVEIEA